MCFGPCQGPCHPKWMAFGEAGRGHGPSAPRRPWGPPGSLHLRTDQHRIQTSATEEPGSTPTGPCPAQENQVASACPHLSKRNRDWAEGRRQSRPSKWLGGDLGLEHRKARGREWVWVPISGPLWTVSTIPWVSTFLLDPISLPDTPKQQSHSHT